MNIQSVTIDTTGTVSNLCEIAMEFNSDKCPYSKETTSGHRHPYTPVYDTLFSSLRTQSINIAEIGIEKNDSINIWRKYFPNADIYGFEYNEQYLQEAINQNLSNVYYEKIDVTNPNNIRETFQIINKKYDILIDDSTHFFEDQIRVIQNSIEYLNEGGILVVEDIFRNRSEEDYQRELQGILKYFSSATFMTTEHENKFSGDWNNDKLLVLVRNDVKVEKSKVFIVTPSRRPFNLEFIAETIPQECEWVVVFDKTVKNEHTVENATVIHSQDTGFWGNPNRNIGLEYIKNNLHPSDNDWIYILDDDNVIHPEWWSNIQLHLNSTESIITWGQVWASGQPRTEPTDTPKIATIDTSQYMVRWKLPML
jgi:hypothetical protein